MLLNGPNDTSLWPSGSSESQGSVSGGSDGLGPAQSCKPDMAEPAEARPHTAVPPALEGSRPRLDMFEA
jgi:hypothetical protein